MRALRVSAVVLLALVLGALGLRSMRQRDRGQTFVTSVRKQGDGALQETLRRWIYAAHAASNTIDTNGSTHAGIAAGRRITPAVARAHSGAYARAVRGVLRQQPAWSSARSARVSVSPLQHVGLDLRSPQCQEALGPTVMGWNRC